VRLPSFGRRVSAPIDFDALPDDDFIVGAYHYLYGVKPDPGGMETFRNHLRDGTRTRRTMLAEMRGVDDWWLQRYLDPLISLHLSRRLWVLQLPPARRILDLGGTDMSSPAGALVKMGYPYHFERLAIVDLPPDQRHPLYNATHGAGTVESSLGPVEYHERSMTDLSVFEDASFDLVMSGQSIEHVTQEDAARALAEAHRVLRPDGYLCLDTPNGAACRLQMGGEGVTNPDHEIEYTHREMTGMLERAGFRIELERGLNFLPETFASGTFSFEELARYVGVFADIERCYLLAYICRPR
jgi:predicted SAM-dependent methyltransferase